MAANSGGLWADVSAGYRRGLSELHAAMYPDWPSIPDHGRRAMAPEAGDTLALGRDSVLQERLQSPEPTAHEPGREEPEMDRD